MGDTRKSHRGSSSGRALTVREITARLHERGFRWRDLRPALSPIRPWLRRPRPRPHSVERAVYVTNERGRPVRVFDGIVPAGGHWESSDDIAARGARETLEQLRDRKKVMRKERRDEKNKTGGSSKARVAGLDAGIALNQRKINSLAGYVADLDKATNPQVLRVRVAATDLFHALTRRDRKGSSKAFGRGQAWVLVANILHLYGVPDYLAEDDFAPRAYGDGVGYPPAVQKVAKLIGRRSARPRESTPLRVDWPAVDQKTVPRRWRVRIYEKNTGVFVREIKVTGASATWDGDRDDGSRATTGLYIACFETVRGKPILRKDGRAFMDLVLIE